jgi:hypothetical protein
MKQIRAFVGMDVHKETISVSIAEDGPEEFTTLVHELAHLCSICGYVA